MIPRRDVYRGQSYKLYDDYNCFHIFVEDAGFENLYKEIFSRYGLPLVKVFSKDGKTSVLTAANSCSDPKCIFLVDRDWDDFFKIDASCKNVVVLEKHSIESYLIDYSGFSSVVVAEFPRVNIAELLTESSYEEILMEVSGKLRQLFQCFLSMQMCATRSKGCSRKPGSFQTRDSFCAPDENKISQFILDSGVTISPAVIKYFSDNDLSGKGHGKFMLHYVWEGIRKKTGVRKISIDSLMIRLAQLVNTVDIERIIANIKSKVPVGSRC